MEIKTKTQAKQQQNFFLSTPFFLTHHLKEIILVPQTTKNFNGKKTNRNNWQTSMIVPFVDLYTSGANVTKINIMTISGPVVPTIPTFFTLPHIAFVHQQLKPE